MNVVWVAWARRDLERIHAQIARDSLPRALAVVQAIVTAIQRLAEFPGLGRPGRKEKTRELVVTRQPYIVVYREQGDRVIILRILHQSQEGPVLAKLQPAAI